LCDQKKQDEAIVAYHKAIALDPNFAHANNGLGNALCDQKKQDEAIVAYHKAIALDPNFAHAYNGLGNALCDQKKLDEAIACYRKAIALDPKDAYAYNGLGNALSDQKKLDEAIACYRKAIALDPKDAKAHNNLGNTLSDQKKLHEAIAEFRNAIELDPKYAKAHYNLGVALKAQGMVEPSATRRQPNWCNCIALRAYPLNRLQKSSAFRRARPTGIGLSPAPGSTVRFVAPSRLRNADRFRNSSTNWQPWASLVALNNRGACGGFEHGCRPGKHQKHFWAGDGSGLGRRTG
jgi:tetratricopeptide (TPR) repeat protein